MNKQLQQVLKKLSRLERVLVLAFLAGAVAFVALMNLGKSSAAELQRIDRQVADAQRQLRAIQDDDLPGLTARLGELREQSITFPGKSEAEAAVVDLWRWAEAGNISLGRTNYSTSEKKAGEWQVPQHVYSVEGAGELQDVIAYLRTIEGSAYQVAQLDNWSLAPAGPQLWRFTFTLNIWSQGRKTETEKKN